MQQGAVFKGRTKPLVRLSQLREVLATNVVSEFRCVRPHGAGLAWLDGLDDADLHLSAVIIGEIQPGIKITREQDKKAAEIEVGLEQVSRTYDVLPMKARALRHCALGAP